MILGIDFGSTTTKIVLMDNLKVVETYRIENYESYEEILGKMDLSKVEKIMTVGAGASFIEGDVMGIPTEYVEEFKAVALGGYFLSGYEECMVVSLGTGTSFMYINKDKREHAGGTGIGGALLHSLAKFGLGMDNVREFLELGNKGKLENADLLIKDISKVDIGELYGDATAANMAKINKDSSPEDYAFGVCNLVFQNVGVMAVMADRPYGTKKIVIMGSIGDSDVARRCFNPVGDLFGYEFFIPKDAVYGVAIGAILYGDDNYVNQFSVYGNEIEDDCYLFE